MTTNIYFESTLYQQSQEIIVTLIEKYSNFKKFYFKLGPNIASTSFVFKIIQMSLNFQSYVQN